MRQGVIDLSTLELSEQPVYSEPGVEVYLGSVTPTTWSSSPPSARVGQRPVQHGRTRLSMMASQYEQQMAVREADFLVKKFLNLPMEARVSREVLHLFGPVVWPFWTRYLAT